MKKISSDSTFFYKRVIPFIWLGGVTLFFIGELFSESISIDRIPFWVIVLFMFILGFFIFKLFLFNLIDEVYDEGDCLLFVNNNKRVNVKLKDIKKLNYQTSNPPKITLSISYETEFGYELAFSPPRTNHFINWRKNKIAEDLIDRINQAKEK